MYYGVVMAEPPNALTDLMREAKTPENMFDILSVEQRLTPVALRERDQVIAVINGAEAAHHQQETAGMAGSTREYVIAGHLIEAGFLNVKARRLLATNTASKWARSSGP